LRPFHYWSAATALVVGLLLLIWAVAGLVQAQPWPFYRIWGAAFVVVGVLVALAAVRAPTRFWKAQWRATDDPGPPVKEARRFLAILAAGLAVRGGIYAATGNLWALIAGFAFVTPLWRATSD
jgi:uncharacterized membrane protein